MDSPIKIDKLIKAIDSKTSDMAPGSDNIPPETVMLAKESSLLEYLHKLLLQCLEDGAMSQYIRDAKIIADSRNERERRYCNSCIGIPLLDFA